MIGRCFWALCLWLLILSASAEVVLKAGPSGGPGGLASWALRRLQAELQGTGMRLVLATGGSDLGQLNRLSTGEVQVALVRSSALANWHRPWALLSLPYLLPEPQSWLQSLEGQRLLASMQGQPVRSLCCWPLGPRCLAAAQPLQDWGQLKGQTVLVPQSRFSWQVYRSLQAVPRPAPLESSAELRQEVQVVEASLLDLEEAGWLTHLPQVWQPGHGEEFLVLVAEERAWRRLSSRQRGQLEAALQRVGSACRGELERRQRALRGRLGSALRVARGRDPFGPVRQQLLNLLDGNWLEAYP